MTLFPVLVDVYHKEQLLTKVEAENVATDERKWIDIAVTKDGVTATRIADILDKYRIDHFAQRIRGKYVLLSMCMVTILDPFEKAQLS